MKPELLEHVNQIGADSHHASNDRWHLLDACDVAELGWELLSGIIELVLGILN